MEKVNVLLLTARDIRLEETCHVPHPLLTRYMTAMTVYLVNPADSPWAGTQSESTPHFDHLTGGRESCDHCVQTTPVSHDMPMRGSEDRCGVGDPITSLTARVLQYINWD